MISEKDFGVFITKKRKELNISQAALAEKLFVDPKTLSKWENGSCYPDLKSIHTMFKLFNVSLDGLIDGSIEKELIRNRNVSAFDNTVFLVAIILTLIILIFKIMNFYNTQFIENVYLLSAIFVLNITSVTLVYLENKRKINKIISSIAKIIYILSAILLYLF